MAQDDKKIAESIRSGDYFVQSRAWFQTLYIGPVAERTFFLIVAVLSILIAIFAVAAVGGLMPLTKRTPVLVYAGPRWEDTYAKLEGIQKVRGDYNRKILEFFVTRYVSAREGYSRDTLHSNDLFVRAQSGDAAYAEYAAANAQTNPQSPIVTLGDMGKRNVIIEKIRFGDDNGKNIAEADFSVEYQGTDSPEPTQWTAKMEYAYTKFDTTSGINPETGKKEVQVTDPHFQVVSYGVESKK